MLTDYDREVIAREYRAILDTIEEYDGPEIIILSIGYCDLWSDGEVTAHGRVIATCDDSGTVTEPEIPTGPTDIGHHGYRTGPDGHGSVEIMRGPDGWHWRACFPGCLPDGEWSGPHKSEADAMNDAFDE